MQRKATIQKAERLVEEFGPQAYEHAGALMHNTKARQET
jgi:hypothetical protein